MRKKKVAVKCVTPIFDVIPNRPILGQISSIELTLAQIRKCLVSRANVREILPNGQYKVLTLSNYDKFDDDPVVEAPVQEIVEPEIPKVEEESIIEEHVEEENIEYTPVVEEHDTEETTTEEPVVEETVTEEVITEESEGEEVVVETIVESQVIEDVTIEEEAAVEETGVEEVIKESPEVNEVSLPEIDNTEEIIGNESEYRPSNNYNKKKKNKR